MAKQIKSMLSGAMSAALTMAAAAAALQTPAFARGVQDEVIAGRLPTNVLCWPSDTHDVALSEHERDAACRPKSANSSRVIDLKTPFRQLDINSVTQLDLIVHALSDAPSSGLFDFSVLSGALASLSKADLLLLKATARGATPAGAARTLPLDGRRVEGIRDFGAHDEGAWVLRPEVPAYLANQAAALRIASQSVRDLRDEIEDSAVDDEAPGFSFWTRAVGRDNELSGSAFSSQTAMTLMHAGIDYGRGSLFGNSDGLHLGVMATYGDAAIAARAADNSAEASGKVTAARVGAYAAWQEGEADRLGAFVDSWFALSVFDNTVIGDDLAAESYRSAALAGAMEAGYGWQPFGSGLRVEPRLQVLYARYDQPSHQEFNGTAVAGAAGGLSLRLGARVDQEWRFDGGMVLRPYAELNWRHDFASSQTSFDGTRVSAATPDDRMEFSVGLDADISANWTAGFVVQTPQAITDYRGVEALISIKTNW